MKILYDQDVHLMSETLAANGFGRNQEEEQVDSESTISECDLTQFLEENLEDEEDRTPGRVLEPLVTFLFFIFYIFSRLYNLTERENHRKRSISLTDKS